VAFRRHSVISILVFLFGLLPLASVAQEINFQHLLAHDGLPQTQVRAVHQDADGYIWVGTYGGAARYNGRDFVVFDTDDGLASNTILSIHATADGRTWMGTTTGLCWIESGQLRFDCSKARQISGNAVQGILPTPDGGVWVATTNGAHRVSRQAPDEVIETLLSARNVVALDRDDDGTVWIGTRTGLFQLNAGESTPNPLELPPAAGDIVLALQANGRVLWIGTETGLFMERDGIVESASGLPDEWMQDNINAMTVGGSGDVWIATNQGVLRHTRDGFDLLTESNGLMSNITYTVFADREGVVWIGNDNGLTRYAPGPFVGYRRKHGLLHYFVRTMNEDDQGNLWLGSRSGAQRVPYRDGEWRFEESTLITAANGLTDARVYSIEFTAPGEALLATGDGVVLWREDEGVVRRYSRKDGLPTDTSQALKKGPDGRVWIGTNLGVVVLQNGKITPAPDKDLANAYVFRIQEDTRGNLWFGSQDRGLFRIADGKVTRLAESDGLTGKTIWDIAPDRDGGLWAGSNGDGLFHVRSDGSIRRYTVADGLVNDFVWQVLVDAQSRVWAYTNAGISRLEDGAFTNYGMDDGLLHLEGGATGAIQTHDGTLWFASADGLMRYVPEFETENALPPPTLVESVTVAGRPIEDGAELPYAPGIIDIQYAALSFESAGEIEYRYRLLGASDDWLVSQRYRPISFANLGAGDYTFEVTARKTGGEWNPEISRFRFSIDSPFWETAWFWLLTVLVFGGLVWFAMRMKVQQARLREHELAMVVEERTQDLQHAADALKFANDQLQSAATTDPLTGLLNRRYLTSQIATDVAQTRRLYRGDGLYPNRDIVFMMIDLDFFKQINDTYGHAAGDHVLRGYGRIIKNEMRESDYVVRWGGEEFLVIARNTEASQSRVIADRIHNAVSDQKFVLDDGTELSVTCSIGVSHLPLFADQPDAMNWEHVIEITDIAVYMSKALGRNGWVSIRGLRPVSETNPAELLQQIKTGLKRLVEDEVVIVESSFESPLNASGAGQLPER